MNGHHEDDRIEAWHKVFDALLSHNANFVAAGKSGIGSALAEIERLQRLDGRTVAAGDGGPAFPHYRSEGDRAATGMSLRDWFAGQALAGILANQAEHLASGSAASWSYDIANNMLAERAKGGAK